MADVPLTRVVASSLEYWYWSWRTHEHRVCTPQQQECARTVLLVGVRLDLLNEVRRNRDKSDTRLPALPNDLWAMLLGWIRRDELGELE